MKITAVEFTIEEMGEMIKKYLSDRDIELANGKLYVTHEDEKVVCFAVSDD